VIRKPSGPPRPRRAAVLAFRAVGLCALALVLADPAAASGGAAMPWDGPLQTIADALTGNTIRLVAVIALAAGGIIWAFTRNEEGVKRIAQAVMGLGVAIGAASFAATLGISGATL
jgi:type IV secretion system protein VirB2